MMAQEKPTEMAMPCFGHPAGAGGLRVRPAVPAGGHGAEHRPGHLVRGRIPDGRGRGGPGHRAGPGHLSSIRSMGVVSSRPITVVTAEAMAARVMQLPMDSLSLSRRPAPT